MSEIFMPYVIFFDDDQALPLDYVERVYEARRPLSYGISISVVKLEGKFLTIDGSPIILRMP
jgi:hypothetical protein